jgi:polyhydroxybutyrate depolymerase
MGRLRKLLACLVLGFMLLPTARADTIKIGDINRTYTVVVPERRPAPLVLVLHGDRSRVLT